MATSTINTRIQLKYDSYSNWQAVADTFVPLNGELCIVSIPASSGAVAQEPAILCKIGDGTTVFQQLPYVSSLAADVYSWAKATDKPSYTAEEISGLADYISGKVQDTDTQYKLEQDATDAHILTLSSKPLGGTWSVVATLTTADTVYDDTALTGRVTSLEELVGSESVAAQIAAAVDAIAIPEYSIVKDDNTSDYAAVYHLTKDGANTGVAINIPKDMVVSSGAVVTDPAGQSAGTYIELTLANAASDKIYINVGDLIEYVTSGSASSDMVVIAIDDDHKVTASITNGSVTKAKLAADVQASLSKADTALQDSDVAAVAKSGDVNDLTQSSGDYVILNCGTASAVV